MYISEDHINMFFIIIYVHLTRHIFCDHGILVVIKIFWIKKLFESIGDYIEIAAFLSDLTNL